MTVLRKLLFEAFLVYEAVQVCFAGRCWNATVESTGMFSSPTFVWVHGVPIIALTFNFTLSSLGGLHSYISIRANNTFSLGEGDFYSVSSTNVSVAQTSLVRNASQAVLNVTILQPALLSEQFISVRGRFFFICRQDDYEFRSPPLTFKYCGKPTYLTIVSPAGNWIYGTIATAQCGNTVIGNKSAIIGRQTTLVCGATAEWSRKDLKCFTGPLIDLNTGVTKVTFDTNTSVLLFCDKFDDNMHYINISFKNATWSGEKMMWTQLVMEPTYHDAIVTCYQSSKTFDQFASRSVKLDIKFPPLIEPNLTVSWGLYLHKQGLIEVTFKSNPTLSGSSKVTAIKQGLLVQHVHYTSKDIRNKVILYFTNVSKADLGWYIITVNSGSPFYQVNNISVYAYERKAERKQETLTEESLVNVPAVALAGTTGIIFIVAFVLTLKIMGIGCFKKSGNGDRVARTTPIQSPPRQTSVHTDNKLKQVSVTSTPVGNPYMQPSQNKPSSYINMGDGGTSNPNDTLYESF